MSDNFVQLELKRCIIKLLHKRCKVKSLRTATIVEYHTKKSIHVCVARSWWLHAQIQMKY